MHFIAIHSQLNGEPEYPRTKQTKVRARLIALAIGTIKSQYRRELMCAVFGLLSLIGRVAEVSPREDEDGRPLPTADLMGYNALGIVFGPLLIGDLLNQYTMKVVTPSVGMLLFPMSPPKFRKERRKSTHIDIKSPGAAYSRQDTCGKQYCRDANRKLARCCSPDEIAWNALPK